MNYILEKTNQVPYFTDMRKTLDALAISAAGYDWFISNLMTNHFTEDFNDQDKWISGEDLQRFLVSSDVQFIWAVFSALPKGFKPIVKDSPFADGNNSYWQQEGLTPQLAGALFEITCWDSSATILVGLPDEAITSFCRVYSDTKPLVAEN